MQFLYEAHKNIKSDTYTPPSRKGLNGRCISFLSAGTECYHHRWLTECRDVSNHCFKIWSFLRNFEFFSPSIDLSLSLYEERWRKWRETEIGGIWAGFSQYSWEFNQKFGLSGLPQIPASSRNSEKIVRIIDIPWFEFLGLY